MYGTEKANNAILQFVARTKERIHACIDHTGPSVMMGVESIKKERLKAVKRRGVKLRYVTEITKENISYCKELMKISDVRHTDGIKGNFEVSDGKEYVAVATLQKAKPVAQLIYSNVMELVEQQQYLFDTLWNRSIPAEQKIMEIEQGIKPDITEIIRNPGEVLKLELILLESAFHEIEIIFSTANVFHFQERLGILHVLRNVAAAAERNVKIRILVPFDKSIKQKLQDLKKLKNFEFREIASSFEIKTKTLVIDRNYSLMMELKDSNGANVNDIFNNGIGVAIYSNSKPIALSFISIFESLWQQSNLVEQLRQTDRMKDEFINIAAHELRTPAQSILGFAELATTDPKYSEQQKQELFIDIIYRNAVRLHRLTKDILDVTKIESHTLYLNKELLNLNNLIANVLLDIQTQTMAIAKGKVSVTYKEAEGDTTGNSDILFVEADKERITQVLHNLLDNAVKFSKDGGIVLLTVEEKNQEDTNNDNEKERQQPREVIVKVEDTGAGIHTEIFPRLFSKFATKSLTGTGLGLYISKSIIESHGGKIWAENNTNGIGATFYFTLPLAK